MEEYDELIFRTLVRRPPEDLDENGYDPGRSLKYEEGDILIGKITPKGESPSQHRKKNYLRAIFGDKAGDVKDASLKGYLPLAKGVVIDKQLIRSRKEGTKNFRCQEIKKSSNVWKNWMIRTCHCPERVEDHFNR
jgi:DNA-directed RNA polymerase beta subunit